ncbi:MAG: gamma-glutamylcyclotransferase [Spirochaetales bacterium]|nr:gamma-glutamylcyclotransferase [Spirochaetales bacterium]
MFMLVYGTLKRGFRNHHLLQPYLHSIRSASFWGKLYHLHDYECPAVIFPEHLAQGSGDYSHDLRIQMGLNQQRHGLFPEVEQEGWTRLSGELVELQNPREAFVVLDQLEGFLCEESPSYERILIPVHTDQGWLYAWAYGMDTIPYSHSSVSKETWTEACEVH